jgi:septal ring factor EnvC (AmiA/AmiB activator)
MAVRKKTVKGQGNGDGAAIARELVVVVEEQRAQFRVFGEALQGVRETLDRRFDEVDRQFEAVDTRFETMDRRFDRVERDLVVVKQELALVKTAVLETNREVKDLRRADEDLYARKVDRDEVEGIVERVLERKGIH